MIEECLIHRVRLYSRDLWSMVRTAPGVGAFFVAISVTGFGNLVAVPLLQIYQIHVLPMTNVQISSLVAASILCAAGFYLLFRSQDGAASPRLAAS
ncbi:MAG: hypothetical protein OWT28_04895 [Firmicutes bacterium]|nr:hypothetical protein [Bacillota bacterium]